MPSRTQRAATAQETVRATENGFYALPSGARIDISADLARAQAGTILYRPDEFPVVRPRPDEARPQIEVTQETTLAAARRLVGEHPQEAVFALNFASAKNPGGGFLGGSQAQEESLARASGLYACLMKRWDYYEENRAHRSCLYTDHMIYSPRVPVFRNDQDELLDAPYLVSFLTAPAVNSGIVRQKERKNASKIAPTMLNRMAKLLAVAAEHNHRVLVLGAWGCGVFGNDPDEVAAWFRQTLSAKEFAGCFERVTFAIVGASRHSALSSFQKAFGYS